MKDSVLPRRRSWRGGRLLQTSSSRRIAASALKKPLPPNAEVHHFSGNQLVLCENHSYHLILHRRAKAYKATGYAHYRECARCYKWDDPSGMRVDKHDVWRHIGKCR